MKLLFFLCAFLLQISLSAQYITPVEPAPADKAVVYFVRTGIDGALAKFTYFDGTKVIGRHNRNKYFRYECDPGEHLFWARGENRDYVEANLEAGKIYIIDVISQAGFVTPAVKLEPVNSPDYNNMKRIKKVLNNDKKLVLFTDKELENWQKKYRKIGIDGVDNADTRQGADKTEHLEGYSFSPLDLRF